MRLRGCGFAATLCLSGTSALAFVDADSATFGAAAAGAAADAAEALAAIATTAVGTGTAAGTWAALFFSCFVFVDDVAAPAVAHARVVPAVGGRLLGRLVHFRRVARIVASCRKVCCAACANGRQRWHHYTAASASKWEPTHGRRTAHRERGAAPLLLLAHLQLSVELGREHGSCDLTRRCPRANRQPKRVRVAMAVLTHSDELVLE